MSDNISLKERDELAEKMLAQVEEIFGAFTNEQSNFIYDLVCDILSEVNQGQEFRALADIPSPPEPRAVRLKRAWRRPFDALRSEVEARSQFDRTLQGVAANGGVAVSPALSGPDHDKVVKEEPMSTPDHLASINSPESSVSNNCITEQTTSAAIGSQSTTVTSPVAPEGSIDGEGSSAAAVSVAATSISAAQNQSTIIDTNTSQMVEDVERSMTPLTSETSKRPREEQEAASTYQNKRIATGAGIHSSTSVAFPQTPATSPQTYGQPSLIDHAQHPSTGFQQLVPGLSNSPPLPGPLQFGRASSHKPRGGKHVKKREESKERSQQASIANGLRHCHSPSPPTSD